MKIKPLLKACAFYAYNAIISNMPFYGIRHWYVRHVFKIQLGAGSSIHMGCFFTGNAITIGSNTVINRNTYLDGRGKLSIGSNVSISPSTYILTLDHDPQCAQFGTVAKEVVINDYAWIGARAMLLPGVTLGKGAIIGAGAIVTKSVPDFSIAAGVPAKTIGVRNKELVYCPSYFPYFNTDILPE